MAEFRLPNHLRRALANLAPVIVTDEVNQLGITEDVVDGVEAFLQAVPTHIRLGLVAGLQAFDSSARAIPSSFTRPFSKLPPAKAKAHFERWFQSKLEPTHQLARGLKMFVSFAYYEHRLVRERLGYLPDAWIEKVSAQRLEQFSEQIAEHEEMLRADDPLSLAGREAQA